MPDIQDVDVVRLGLLYILCKGILGKDKDDRVCVEWFLLVDDLQAWDRYSGLLQYFIIKMHRYKFNRLYFCLVFLGGQTYFAMHINVCKNVLARSKGTSKAERKRG